MTDPITMELRTKEGYFAEIGITPGVNELFSELIPVKIINLNMRPINPVVNVVTDYEIIFSSDAEFNITDSFLFTFPIEINPSITTSRLLLATNSTSRCTSVFSISAKLNCTMVS